MSLNGKTTIVTGAGRGIGQGCAIQLAREGARVAVWDVNPDGAAETVRTIEAEGHCAAAYVGDASDPAEIDRILAQIRAHFGSVQILVNNAALVPFKAFLDITLADLDAVCRTNLMGPFLLTQAVIPDMAAASWGRVISMASASAQQGTKLLSHYAATKGGIAALTRTLAMEFAGQGITVNSISPSFIDTPSRFNAPPGAFDFDAAVAASPMKRAGQPADIAAVVSFLASDGASYVTGQMLSVNGGLVLA